MHHEPTNRDETLEELEARVARLIEARDAMREEELARKKKLPAEFVSLAKAAEMLAMNPRVLRRHVARLGIRTVANPKDSRTRNINVLALAELAKQERRRSKSGPPRKPVVTLTWQDTGEQVVLNQAQAKRKPRAKRTENGGL